MYVLRTTFVNTDVIEEGLVLSVSGGPLVLGRRRRRGRRVADQRRPRHQPARALRERPERRRQRGRTRAPRTPGRCSTGAVLARLALLVAWRRIRVVRITNNFSKFVA